MRKISEPDIWCSAMLAGHSLSGRLSDSFRMTLVMRCELPDHPVPTISQNVSEYEKFLTASLLYSNKRKGQKFGLRKICTPY